MKNVKRCTICRREKGATEFHIGKTKSGTPFLQGRCKSCCRTYLRAWSRTETGVRLKQEWSRRRNLQSYAMNEVAYSQLLADQNGGCAICGGNNADGRRLSVDHDHESDIVRGLLCHCCNVGIGLLKEDVRVLAAAIRYLSLAKGAVA